MSRRLDAANSVLNHTGIPEGWRETAVCELAVIVGGGTPDRAESVHWRDATIPWITPTDLTTNGAKWISTGAECISKRGLENSNASLVPINSLVFSTRGTVGNMALAATPLTCNQSCEILIPRPGEVDGEFLYYLLHFGLSAFIRLSGGTTFGAITRRDIGRVKFAIPRELGEQAEIARILDAVDRALERTRASLSAASEVVDSMREDAVNGRLITPGLRGRRGFEQVHPRLGRIPGGWSVERLGVACNRIVDGTHQAVETCEGGLPFLYVSCIRNGRILWSRASRVTQRTYERISRGREPRAGSVLYTAVGSYGNAALVRTDVPFSFQRHIAILYPREDLLLGSYLTLWLNSRRGKRWSDTQAVGNAQKTVTLTALSKMLIACPPPSIQRELQEVTESAERIVDALEARSEALAALKRGVMHDLLTGRVRLRDATGLTAS